MEDQLSSHAASAHLQPPEPSGSQQHGWKPSAGFCWSPKIIELLCLWSHQNWLNLSNWWSLLTPLVQLSGVGGWVHIWPSFSRIVTKGVWPVFSDSSANSVNKIRFTRLYRSLHWIRDVFRLHSRRVFVGTSSTFGASTFGASTFGAGRPIKIAKSHLKPKISAPIEKGGAMP